MITSMQSVDWFCGHLQYNYRKSMREPAKRSRESEGSSGTGSENMGQSGGETTSPTLLERVRDRRNHPAWAEFFERYDPLLHCWCRRYRLDDESSDELCQRTWNKLFPLMAAFQYDPGRGFRRWLWQLFRSRAMDMLGERRASPLVPCAALSREESCHFLSELDRARIERDDADDEAQPERLALLREAEEAQATVRAQVNPETWRAYWQTTIEDRPVAEVAKSLGKSYAAVYYGAQRVARMLRREGERRLDKLMSTARESCETD